MANSLRAILSVMNPVLMACEHMQKASPILQDFTHFRVSPKENKQDTLSSWPDLAGLRESTESYKFTPHNGTRSMEWVCP